jgi:endonuclease/exonuclease/phosphatase (EEP) superfamily protein YafD
VLLWSNSRCHRRDDILAILLGDVNADRATVGAGLLGDFVFAIPTEPALPTRPRTTGSKSEAIDHVIVRGGTPVDATVLDVGGISDHNLVVARVKSGRA